MGCHRKIWHTHMDFSSSSTTSTTNSMKSGAAFPMLLSEGCSVIKGEEEKKMKLRERPRRIKWMGLVQMGLVLLLFVGEWLILPVGGSEDWTLQCPSGCKCTWVSGKKTADCRGSSRTTIPSGLSPEVQLLEMGGCNIEILPKDAFKSVGLVNLQKVFLQNCRIKEIDRDAFRDLTIMIELDMSGNLFSSINMETFESNVRLRELKLSKNPLSELTGRGFPPLMYLKLLDFTDCHFTTFPKKAFDNLTVLETLSLSGNRFTYLSEELLRPLIKLKSLSLAGNPWKCDCKLKSLREFVIARNLFQHHTKCTEPAHVANFPWDQLMSADFACRPEIVSVQINGKPTDALLVHTDIGSDITLECLVRANPPAELKWVRDGQVLTNTSRSYGKSYYLHIGDESWDSEGSSRNYPGRWVNLTIQKTDPEDAGEYTCVGSNAGGVVEKNLTLNFQDVPSGAGVGHGLGGLGSGNYRDTGWIWILITVLAVLVFATSMITVVCFCSRRRRVKTTRAQDLKGVEGRDDQPQQRQLLLTPTQRSDGSEKNDDDGTTMLLMKEKYLVGPDARSQSADILNNYGTEMDSFNNHRPSSAQQMQPPPPSNVLTAGPHGVYSSTEYPDLLDLPHTRFQESPAPSTVSTLPDSTRMLITPQQLNPAMLVNPSSRMGYNQHPIYSHGGRPVSPYGFSPSEPAIVPAGSRPGYVTLPRRPRVPSWSPGPSTLDSRNPASPNCPPSPTGSAATISLPFVTVRPKYDNLGPRTSVDGSSRLSLNNIGDGSSAPSTPSNSNYHPQQQQPLVTGTLGRHSMLRSTPNPGGFGQPISHFAPIQEIEPVSTPTSEAPHKSFGGGGGSPTSRPFVGNGPTNSKTEPSTLDGTPKPNQKKVPPKPPPKPSKKKSPPEGTNPNGGLHSSSNNSQTKSPEPHSHITAIGDDGTEV